MRQLWDRLLTSAESRQDVKPSTSNSRCHPQPHLRASLHQAVVTGQMTISATFNIPIRPSPVPQRSRTKRPNTNTNFNKQSTTTRKRTRQAPFPSAPNISVLQRLRNDAVAFKMTSEHTNHQARPHLSNPATPERNSSRRISKTTTPTQRQPPPVSTSFTPKIILESSDDDDDLTVSRTRKRSQMYSQNNQTQQSVIPSTGTDSTLPSDTNNIDRIVSKNQKLRPRRKKRRITNIDSDSNDDDDLQIHQFISTDLTLGKESSDTPADESHQRSISGKNDGAIDKNPNPSNCDVINIDHPSYSNSMRRKVNVESQNKSVDVVILDSPPKRSRGELRKLKDIDDENSNFNLEDDNKPAKAKENSEQRKDDISSEQPKSKDIQSQENGDENDEYQDIAKPLVIAEHHYSTQAEQPLKTGPQRAVLKHEKAKKGKGKHITPQLLIQKLNDYLALPSIDQCPAFFKHLPKWTHEKEGVSNNPKRVQIHIDLTEIDSEKEANGNVTPNDKGVICIDESVPATKTIDITGATNGKNGSASKTHTQLSRRKRQVSRDLIFVRSSSGIQDLNNSYPNKYRGQSEKAGCTPKRNPSRSEQLDGNESEIEPIVGSESELEDTTCHSKSSRPKLFSYNAVRNSLLTVNVKDIQSDNKIATSNDEGSSKSLAENSACQYNKHANSVVSTPSLNSTKRQTTSARKTLCTRSIHTPTKAFERDNSQQPENVEKPINSAFVLNRNESEKDENFMESRKSPVLKRFAWTGLEKPYSFLNTTSDPFQKSRKSTRKDLPIRDQDAIIQSENERDEDDRGKKKWAADIEKHKTSQNETELQDHDHPQNDINRVNNALGKDKLSKYADLAPKKRLRSRFEAHLDVKIPRYDPDVARPNSIGQDHITEGNDKLLKESINPNPTSLSPSNQQKSTNLTESVNLPIENKDEDLKTKRCLRSNRRVQRIPLKFRSFGDNSDNDVIVVASSNQRSSQKSSPANAQLIREDDQQGLHPSPPKKAKLLNSMRTDRASPSDENADQRVTVYNQNQLSGTEKDYNMTSHRSSEPEKVDLPNSGEKNSLAKNDEKDKHSSEEKAKALVTSSHQAEKSGRADNNHGTSSTVKKTQNSVIFDELGGSLNLKPDKDKNTEKDIIRKQNRSSFDSQKKDGRSKFIFQPTSLRARGRNRSNTGERSSQSNLHVQNKPQSCAEAAIQRSSLTRKPDQNSETPGEIPERKECESAKNSDNGGINPRLAKATSQSHEKSSTFAPSHPFNHASSVTLKSHSEPLVPPNKVREDRKTLKSHLLKAHSVTNPSSDNVPPSQKKASNVQLGRRHSLLPSPTLHHKEFRSSEQASHAEMRYENDILSTSKTSCLDHSRGPTNQQAKRPRSIPPSNSRRVLTNDEQKSTSSLPTTPNSRDYSKHRPRLHFLIPISPSQAEKESPLESSKSADFEAVRTAGPTSTNFQRRTTSSSPPRLRSVRLPSPTHKLTPLHDENNSKESKSCKLKTLPRNGKSIDSSHTQALEPETVGIESFSNDSPSAIEVCPDVNSETHVKVSISLETPKESVLSPAKSVSDALINEPKGKISSDNSTQADVDDLRLFEKGSPSNPLNKKCFRELGGNDKDSERKNDIKPALLWHFRGHSRGYPIPSEKRSRFTGVESKVMKDETTEKPASKLDCTTPNSTVNKTSVTKDGKTKSDIVKTVREDASMKVKETVNDESLSNDKDKEKPPILLRLPVVTSLSLKLRIRPPS